MTPPAFTLVSDFRVGRSPATAISERRLAMKSGIELEFALQLRCRTVCEELSLPRSQGRQFVANVLDRFLVTGHGVDADHAWKTITYVLSQAFHCRLPDVDDVASLRAAFATGSVVKIYDAFIESPKFRHSPQAKAMLVPVVKDGLVMDVSETARVPFTSGIQRVVRSVARHVRRQEPEALLVRWDDRVGCFVPLEPDEIDRLLHVEPCPVRGRSPARSRSPVQRILRAIGRGASWPKRRIAKTLKRSRNEMSSDCPQPSVFVWESSLLLPELVVGEAHVEAVRFACAATPLRATMVFYDAIPIRHPEFFTGATHSVYLRSLSLARDIDSVSCISQTVRDDLEHLLNMLPIRRPPILAVHYLGADLPEREPARPIRFDRPVALCIGTIEPRKNQMRVLQAMLAAQKTGATFTGVFAGNTGWLNTAFRDAFARAVAAGHDLVLRENVTDAELRGLYASSTFTVYCSLDEGLGLPIIESLQHGRPCIVSDRGSMREIASRTGGCLLVDPENVAEMSTAIQRLSSEPHELTRLTREAEQAVWPNWRDYTRQLLRFVRTPACVLAVETRRAA